MPRKAKMRLVLDVHSDACALSCRVTNARKRSTYSKYGDLLSSFDMRRSTHCEEHGYTITRRTPDILIESTRLRLASSHVKLKCGKLNHTAR
jgi:hypothetical protein